MDDDLRSSCPGACPHVDRDDARCSSRFSLGRIDQAFCVCFGAFHACPMYHRINSELPRATVSATGAAIVTVSAHGHALSLRATGT
jgi:hypothetical protein